MTEQQIANGTTSNSRLSLTSSRRGRKKDWKDLSLDPLSEGFDSHQADYVVGRATVTWSNVQPGQLFSRSKSGKNLHVKINDGRGICLDTRQAIEVKPTIRDSLQVWIVTNFNSTSVAKTEDF
jgi:hypothetical protein